MTTRKPPEAIDLDPVARLPVRRPQPRSARERRRRWAEAERQLQDLEHELRAIVANSGEELGAAASRMVEALRETYRELRQALESR